MKYEKSGWLATVVAGLSVLLAPTPALSATTDYSLVHLDARGGYYSSANAINASGQIAGAWPGAMLRDRATLLSDDVYTDLGAYDLEYYSTSNALAINAGGSVVGYINYYDSTRMRNVQYAYLWQGGSKIELSSPRLVSQALDINDANQIVGITEWDSGFFHATLWQNGSATELISPAGRYYYSYATSINNKGQVAGFFQTEDHSYKAVTWVDGKATVLDQGSAIESQAVGINDAGSIVGNLYEGGLSRPVIWEGGSFSYLAGLKDEFGRTVAINNLGLVIGYSYDASALFGWRATLWKDGVAIDLSALLDPELTGKGMFLNVLDINDAGQIVGNIQDTQTGILSPVLLNPTSAVPEPATAVLYVLGGVFFVVTARRARKTPHAAQAA